MKFLIIHLILFAFLPIGIQAQNVFNLTGEVRDTANIPISQAVVAIEETAMGTYSNSNGNYSLKIPSGKYTVAVMAYGYQSLKKDIEINNNQVIHFILKDESIELTSVDVYGKSESQQLRESAFSVNAINIKKFTSSLNNLNTLVGSSSGIKIREDGGVGSDFDLSINGLAGNSIRYFIDGVPLSSIGNGVTLSNIPVNIVERIEVYKGVVPAFLGSDALGGAINIITKKNKQNFLDASYGVGSFSTHKADFNAQYISPKSGVFIQPSLGINYSKNNYLMKGVEVSDSSGRFHTVDAKRFHDDFFSVLSQIKVGVAKKEWADLFSVSASYFYSDKELQTGSQQHWVRGAATRSNNSFNISGQYQKHNFLVEGLAADLSLMHTWDNRIVTDTSFYKYKWDGSKSFEGDGNELRGGPKSIRHIDRPVTIGRVNFNYLLNDRHTFKFNYLINYLSNKRYDDLDESFEPSEDVLGKQIIGISYSQSFWNNKLNNTFFVKDYINHLKIEQQDDYWITGSDEVPNSFTTNNWGYGFGSRLQLNNPLGFKVSYEQSVRLPVAREFLGNGTTIDANFKLRPESSDNINAGVFGTFYFTGRHRLFYEGGFFYRKVEDYIRFIAAQNEGYGQYENNKNVTVKGVEGEFRYSYNNVLQVIANISYLEEINKTKFKDDGKPDVSYNLQMPNRPWFYSNVQCNYRKNQPFGAEDSQLMMAYYFHYVHWYYFTWKELGAYNKDLIPTQYSHDIRLTYSIKQEKYNISLECNNIFDRTLYDNFRMQKPGRSFFLKLRIFIY